jgi:hypothetical protein
MRLDDRAKAAFVHAQEKGNILMGTRTVISHG